MIQSGQPHYLATANVDFLIQARQDIELRRVLNDADLVLCDGTPLVWLSRFFGNPLPERVAGSDLTPLLIELAAEKGYRIFFLGGQADVAAAAASRLQERYPNLMIAGHYSPPFRPLLDMDNEEIARRIRAAHPDIVFVSFGCPKAEKWMAINYRKVGAPVMIGVGATIDFLAGRVKRAPQWMQKSGTEWLYRLSQEPRRLFRRYARDFAHLGCAVLNQWWHCHSPFARSGVDRLSSIAREDANWLHLRLPCRLDKEVVARDAHIWNQIRGSDCLVSMDGVRCIDSTGMALLVRLHHRLRREARHLVLLAPRRCVVRALRWAGLRAELLVARDAAHAEKLVQKSREQSAEPVVESSLDWTLPVTWRGEITCANRDLVWERTHAYLSMCSARRRQTAVDLSQVRFLDTGGLEVMTRARGYARQLGMQLDFIGLSSDLRRLIRLSGLDKELLGQIEPPSTPPSEGFTAPRIPVPAV
jgi:N-acetylglucosaminyldiphosphoundecaprenol N-acetyl-beta-D-mannosaminyltransferase